MPYKERPLCINCEKPCKNLGNIYCSNKCQWEYAYKEYIRLWLDEKLPLEKVSGSHGQISAYVKKYLREKYSNKCARCGWNTPHPSDGIPPLEVEHIDGNWRNSTESNLILLCPNCHSLTVTYKNRNRGNGFRPNRKQR